MPQSSMICQVELILIRAKMCIGLRLHGPKSKSHEVVNAFQGVSFIELSSDFSPRRLASICPDDPFPRLWSRLQLDDEDLRPGNTDHVQARNGSL